MQNLKRFGQKLLGYLSNMKPGEFNVASIKTQEEALFKKLETEAIGCPSVITFFKFTCLFLIVLSFL